MCRGSGPGAGAGGGRPGGPGRRDLPQASSAGGPTLAEAAELFARATGRERSGREYGGVLRSLSRFCAKEGRTRCGQLDPDLLLRHQAQLASSTRHHRLLLLRQWLRHLERAGLPRPVDTVVFVSSQ